LQITVTTGRSSAATKPNEPAMVQQNESSGVRIAYDDVGDGPAILFIHGFMFDRTMWHEQVAALDGWRRIAPDLRGMGESEAPDGGYDMAAYADDLAALLDVLGIEQAALCGLSLGGYIAFEFLRRYRERVTALIVMSARAEADTPERKASRDDMIARVRRYGVRTLAEELAPRFLEKTAAPDTKERLQEMMERTSVAGAVGALEAMRDRPDSTPLLSSLGGLPTLFVIGERDVRTPRATMQPMADRLPRARFEVIPDAGHVAPLESPAEITAQLRSFLNELCD
jgi:3-oxoadipate enol-lactonase